jgi:hypothetical protein
MPDASRPGGVAAHFTAAEVGQTAARPEGEATAVPCAMSAAGLSHDELSAMVHDRPNGDPSAPAGDSRTPEALASYVAGTGLSGEAYNEWLARVCKQSDNK